MNRVPYFTSLISFCSSIFLLYFFPDCFYLAVLIVAGISCFSLFFSTFKTRLITHCSFLLLGLILFHFSDKRGEAVKIHSNKVQAVYFKAHLSELKRTPFGWKSIGKVVDLVFSNSKRHLNRNKYELVFDSLPKNAKNGSVICGYGLLKPIPSNEDETAFDKKYYSDIKQIIAQIKIKGIPQILAYEPTFMDRMYDFRTELCKKMACYLKGDALAVTQALVLAEQSQLDDEVQHVFSATGSMHVLAVSGMHISIFLIVLELLLIKFHRWLPGNFRWGIAIVIVWFYGCLTGASPAVMRAVVLFTLVAIGRMLNRTTSVHQLICATAWILLIYNPWYLFDLGFQLSHAALIGIIGLGEPMSKLFSFKQGWLNRIWSDTMASLAATVATLPLILFWFHQFPLYFWLANLGLIVLGFVILILGLLFLLSLPLTPLAFILSVVLSCSVYLTLIWLGWVSDLPAAVLGGYSCNIWEQIFLIFILILLVYCLHNTFKYSTFVLYGSCVVFFGFVGFIRLKVAHKQEFVIVPESSFCAWLKTNKDLVLFYEDQGDFTASIDYVKKRIAAFYGITPKTVCLKKNSKTEIKFNEHKISFEIGYPKNSIHIDNEPIDFQKGNESKSHEMVCLSKWNQLKKHPNHLTVFKKVWFD